MRRRNLILLLGGAPVMLPLAARAQQTERVRRIGILSAYTETNPINNALAAFLDGLRKLGWEEGRNIRLDYRWPGSSPDRALAHARELIALRPDVLFSHNSHTVVALLEATREIPIVFTNIGDPVRLKIADNLSRPGGNATGFSQNPASLGGKWVQLLYEIDPRIVRVGMTFNPETASSGEYYYWQSLEDAARSLRIEAVKLPVRNSLEVEAGLAALGSQPNSGLVVVPDFAVSVHGELIRSLATRYRLPTIYAFRSYTEAGGLISFGAVQIALFRNASTYVDLILRGAHPRDLPIQLPTKFELVINLKTAKAMGLELSPTLLARADDVIE